MLLRGGTLVTVDSARNVLRADLLVEEGRIARIAPRLRAPAGVDVLDCRGKLVLPGFVQGHTHLCQTLFRNQADGLPLLDWLSQRIWPLEAAHDARSLPFSARLGIAELLLSGTTCILDMATVHHTGALLGAVLESGLRYTGGKCLMDAPDSPDGLRETTAEALAEAERLGARWQGEDEGRIRWALCPRFALSCTERLLRRVSELSERRGWMVHTHASENREEVAAVRRRTGSANIAYLRRVGLCGPRTAIAHCVHLDAEEVRILARSGATAVHCPGANLKLASGIAAVPRLLRSGVNVALGADGAACNNSLDAFHEMRLAGTLHLPRSGADAIAASEVVAMATIRGARALGLESEIGSLGEGKRADLAVVDLSAPHLVPAGADPHATIVYSACKTDVTDTIVDGRWLVRARRLIPLDAADLTRRAAAEAARVFERAFRTSRPDRPGRKGRERRDPTRRDGNAAAPRRRG
jgi:cytosine/adenosine deaminase-related metal-dependent hydrolase